VQPYGKQHGGSSKTSRRHNLMKLEPRKGRSQKNTKEIQRITREYFEKLYSDKLGHLVDKFLDVYDLPKLNK
jgi:hypothetical protein